MSFHTITFKKKLPIEFKKDLEKVFFFNTNQTKHLEGIQKSIDSYGLMKIVEDGKFLTLEFEKSKPESLFALDGDGFNSSFLGVICYEFKGDICEIYHIAVDPECTFAGSFEPEMITYRLVEKVRKIAMDHNSTKLKSPIRINILTSNKKSLPSWNNELYGLTEICFKF
ncbi:MAG: hypothetical protein IPJ75_03880 [Ignavibacteriales bacterium]|nr:hypothetical protein [Ignavibacteriales bacterium]